MTDRQSEPRKGRPPKFPGSGARQPHSVRLKPAVADQLRAQAANNMRSIGEEIEARIDSTFLQEGFIPAAEPSDAGFLIKYFDERLRELECRIHARVDEHALLQAKTNNLFMRFIHKFLLDRIIDETSKLEAEKVKGKMSHDDEVTEQYINFRQEEIGELERLQKVLDLISKDNNISIDTTSKRMKKNI